MYTLPSSLVLLILVVFKPAISAKNFTSAGAVEGKEVIPCGGDYQNTTSVCPPWSVCSPNSHHCKCMAQVGHVHCGARVTLVLFCYCLTRNAEYSEYRLGKCFYNCGQGNPFDRTSAYYRLPSDPSKINEAMCGSLNRAGTLCGQCQNDSFPLVYSYNVNCIKCTKGYKNWWKFILAAFGPLTIFYLIVLLSRSVSRRVTCTHLCSMPRQCPLRFSYALYSWSWVTSMTRF